MLLFILS